MSEPLLFAAVHQPHIFFSFSNTSDSCQVRVYYIYFVLYILIYYNYILGNNL